MASGILTGTDTRSVSFPPVPRASDAPGGAPAASSFYSRTAYRDSFVNPIHAAAGPLLGLGISPGSLGNTRAVPGTAAIRRGPRGARTAARAPTDPPKRSMNYSRTTYTDAFGMPYPIVVVDPDET
jgi:hypothetical protein